jgi:hypothetical protein
MNKNTPHKKNDSTLKATPAQQLVEESMKTSEDANKLSTIRDILFGEQAREDEEKRNSLHKELKANLSQLQQETQSQFDQVSSELKKLHSLITTETEHRLTNNKSTNQQITHLQHALDESNRAHQQEQSKLQKEFTQKTDELNQQAKKWHQELSEKLEVASKELRSDKTDKGDLAKMLRGMAEQLANGDK